MAVYGRRSSSLHAFGNQSDMMTAAANRARIEKLREYDENMDQVKKNKQLRKWN